MGKLPPPEDGCQAEKEELPTNKDGLENIGRIRRIRHGPMVSPLPVRLAIDTARRPLPLGSLAQALPSPLGGRVVTLAPIDILALAVLCAGGR